MGCRSCDKPKMNYRKGLWSPEEDQRLRDYILKHGLGCWSAVPAKAGLQRNGKSCRLRWINYLRPGLKRGMFSQEEEDVVINLQAKLGNKWSQIAMHLPGRTDNEVKNYWNSYLKKRVMQLGSNSSSNPASKNASPELLTSMSATTELIMTGGGGGRQHGDVDTRPRRQHRQQRRHLGRRAVRRPAASASASAGQELRLRRLDAGHCGGGGAGAGELLHVRALAGLHGQLRQRDAVARRVRRRPDERQQLRRAAAPAPAPPPAAGTPPPPERGHRRGRRRNGRRRRLLRPAQHGGHLRRVHHDERRFALL
ncbi:hypothetical protein CFC21_091118, partial [Triticum aestivum]